MVPRMSHDQDAVGGIACSRLYRELQECLALHTSVATVRGFSLHGLCPGGCPTDTSDTMASKMVTLACSRRAFRARCQLLPGALSPASCSGRSHIPGSQVCCHGARAQERSARCVARPSQRKPVARAAPLCLGLACRICSGSCRSEWTLEYWTGRRADYQAAVSQTPNVWTCPQ